MIYLTLVSGESGVGLPASAFGAIRRCLQMDGNGVSTPSPRQLAVGQSIAAPRKNSAPLRPNKSAVAPTTGLAEELTTKPALDFIVEAG